MASKKIEYVVLDDDTFLPIDEEDGCYEFGLACCDCGLVHTVRVLSVNFSGAERRGLIFTRDPELTKQLRAEMQAETDRKIAAYFEAIDRRDQR